MVTMKRPRKVPAPKAVNGHARVRELGVVVFEPVTLRYPSCKPFTDLDREFGPWVRVGNQWVRAKRRR